MENSLDRVREYKEMNIEAETNGASGQGDERVGTVQVLYFTTIGKYFIGA